MLDPVICPQCLQPNERARDLCWKCLRTLSEPPAWKEYERLFGLSLGWRADDLKASFRRLAKKYHPDMNPGNREADAFFKYVNQAYEVLSQPSKAPKKRDESVDELYKKLENVARWTLKQCDIPPPQTRLQKLKQWFVHSLHL